MTQTTITIDETVQAQIVYSRELDKFLQIYLLSTSDISGQVADFQKKIIEAQAQIDKLAVLSAEKGG